MHRLPDLDQITAFLAVAEALSFRRAAERLALDQSALSRRIKDLEHRVGCQLLVRTTHAVRLTEAGRSYYDANEGLVQGLAAAAERARRIAGGASGALTIGFMTFAAIDLLPRAARRFSAENPEVALAFAYEPTEAQKLSLARGRIDVGLLLGPFEHSDFETVTLARERLLALMPADHPLAAREQLALAELKGVPLVLGTDAQWDFYRRLVGEALAAAGVPLEIAAEAPTLTSILGLVRAGFGITLAPEVLAGFLPAGVVARPIIDPVAPIETVAAWLKPGASKIAAFLACCHPPGATSAAARAPRARHL